VFCLGISFRDRRVYIHPAFISEMAVSPFVSRSPSATVSSPNAALRLRAPAAQNVSGLVATTKAVYSADRELTEQLNDDVRQKYVKGQSGVQGLQ
jgi:cyclin-dependent kinase 7